MNTIETLDSKQVVRLYPHVAKTEQVLANLRNQKRGPRYFKVGRKVVYKQEDIEAYLFKNPILTIDSIG